MIEDIERLIGDAVQEVFTTMLNMSISPTSVNTMQISGEEHVASAVGFIGRLTGVIYIYANAHFAARITASLLGIEEKDIDGNEMVNDAMGEVANMVVGQIKSRLSDRGMPCVLTIPSIVRGSHFTIEPVSTTERRVVAYNCGDRSIIVELLVKPVS